MRSAAFFVSPGWLASVASMKSRRPALKSAYSGMEGVLKWKFWWEKTFVRKKPGSKMIHLMLKGWSSFWMDSTMPEEVEVSRTLVGIGRHSY